MEKIKWVQDDFLVGKEVSFVKAWRSTPRNIVMLKLGFVQPPEEPGADSVAPSQTKGKRYWCRSNEIFFDLQLPFGDDWTIITKKRADRQKLWKYAVRCSHAKCKEPAARIDSFYPYHQEYCLCAEHAEE